ncbi:MAG TPA: arginine--tRNA ligase [Candidatus Limnocylindria bacterium]|nr:arginine--tRNA ligase [Candidatus Limnocylindria bacterium]
MPTLREQLRDAVTQARRAAAAAGELPLPDEASLPPVGIEHPSRPEHGDFATNAAMQLAPLARNAPLRIADALLRHLSLPPGVASVETAAPGFINFRLDPAWVAGQVAAIRDAGSAYGAHPVARPRRINVEFVSANPTGPLTIGNARGAFVGDLLARVLEAVGHEVTREYYFNDGGTQVDNLGLSVLARREGSDIPEDGYRGAYVADLARELPEDVLAGATAPGTDTGAVLGAWAAERIRASIERSLANLGVRFDVWTSEVTIERDGWMDRGLAALREAGHLFEEEGATWFRSTAFGDDRDRVVLRSDGRPTYFAKDIGYVMEKFSRGFDELIYLWGEDHHGTVARLRNAAQALGFDREAVQMILIAWVRFIRNGQEIGASKRSGEFITLDELLGEIGVDAARWFFGARATSTGIDFDMDLATAESSENPVYYVQYAHARCASILRHAAERSVTPDAGAAADLLHHPAEQALIKHLLTLPDVLADASERRETHELPRFCHEAASLYSQFYRDCRVLSDDAPLSAARLALVDVTRQVLANALGLMGISAPDSM